MKILIFLSACLCVCILSCTPKTAHAQTSITVGERPRLGVPPETTTTLTQDSTSPNSSSDESTTMTTSELPIDTLITAPANTIPRGGFLSISTFRSNQSVALSPFLGSPDSSTILDMLFTLSFKTPRIVAMHLAKGLSNAHGEEITAFDCVDALNTLCKDRSACARGLFVYVDGMDDLLVGKEAVLRGMRVFDASTILFSLTIPDSRALTRMKSFELLPASLALGPYTLASSKINELKANRLFVGGIPMLDSLRIYKGGDSNPFVGFSRGVYDLVELVFQKDISYAKSNLSASGSLTTLQTDRYFLSITNAMPLALRKALKNSLRLPELIRSELRVQAQPITSLFANDSILSTNVLDTTPLGVTMQPKSLQPFSVLVRQDDPVSMKLGRTLLNRLSSIGIPCTLDCKDETPFEKTLATRRYTIAIGYISGEFSPSAGDSLRVGQSWFNSNESEVTRIQAITEIPLFALDIVGFCKPSVSCLSGPRYALCYRNASL